LQYALLKNSVITLELCEDGMDDTGYIKSLEGNILIMACYDNVGNKDGETVINIDNITRISCDSLYEIKIKKYSDKS